MSPTKLITNTIKKSQSETGESRLAKPSIYNSLP